MVKRKDETWALFWCSLLHPVLFGEVEAHEVAAFLRRLAGEERTFPNGACKKPSLTTLQRKLRNYQRGGFEALGRQARSDRGTTPSAPIATPSGNF